MKPIHPLYRKWRSIYFWFLMSMVMAGGIAVGCIMAYVSSMPRLEKLENYNPPGISRIYDRTGNVQMGEFVKNRREVVRIEDIPEHVQSAFLAIEDERFYDHFGVDVRGIFRALYTNLATQGRMQGASTISMQVARNVVLEDLDRTWTRKLKEVPLALQIERNYSKAQILEFYLNHIFFGARAYGIQAASKAYFNKDVKDLNMIEAAMLAGLPKAPSNLNPFEHPQRSRDRRDTVLGNMYRTGVIPTSTELKRLQALPIEVNPAPPTATIAPYYVDFVASHMVHEDQMDDARDLAEKAYQVVSNVDLNLQRICEEEFAKGLRKVEEDSEAQKEGRLSADNSLGPLKVGQRRLARITEVTDTTIKVSVAGRSTEITLPDKLPYFNPEKFVRKGKLIDIVPTNLASGNFKARLYDKAHVQGAVVVINPKNGEVLAIVGGEDRNDVANAGAYNRAYLKGRQPGSCWKPLLYAGALDAVDKEGNPRYTPGTVIVDSAFSVGNWSPKNYEGKFYGDTTLFEALVKSRNIPTVKMYVNLGAEKSLNIYNSFNMVESREWNLDRYAPMSLGTPDVTPLSLAGAYAAMANGGVGIEPSPVKRLYSSKNINDSRIVQSNTRQVISPEAAYMTTRILQEVVAQGTAKNTVGKWHMEQTAKGRKLPEIAAKTGTTNECFVAWMVGYTPELAVAIYVGYDQPRSMGPKMTGGTTVGPLFANLMDRLLATRDDWQLKFDVPANITFADICGASGQLVSSGCYSSGHLVFKHAAFKSGTEPTRNCYHGGRGTASSYYASAENSNPEAEYQMELGQQYGAQPQPQAPVVHSYPNSYYGFQ